MYYTFVGIVIGISEKWLPIGWQLIRIHGESMILHSHVATGGSMMCNRLIMTAISVTVYKTCMLSKEKLERAIRR